MSQIQVKNLTKYYGDLAAIQDVSFNPEILILDEPTLGLDPKQIMRCES